jgi:C4-dicarboxylate-specific signal transduction histidine kinase
VIDITESTRAREVLQSLNEQLEARVGERTRELAQAHDDLQKAMHDQEF